MNHEVSQANHAQTQEQRVRPLPLFDPGKSRTPNGTGESRRVHSFLTTEDRKLLLTCPPSGGGVHTWTFTVLRMLSKYYHNEENLFRAAKEIFIRFAKRTVPDGEILRQVPNVLRPACPGSDTPMRSTFSKPSSNKKWPLTDVKRIKSIVAEGVTLSGLGRMSPVPLGVMFPTASTIIATLFPGDPLLCCGQAIDRAITQPRSHWGSFESLQFIVPSPMSGKSALNKNGKLSHRCLNNTGPRRFLVVEFDFNADDDAAEKSFETTRASSGPSAKHVNAVEKARFVKYCLKEGLTVQDICAAVINHLSGFVKPVLVVHSGGKSLHAWFCCAGAGEAGLRRFMEYAVALGADPATWTPCQLVRMPGGTRYVDGALTRPQSVCYFNPGGLIE